MRILTFKKVYLIHGKQRLEWLWVFKPWFQPWNAGVTADLDSPPSKSAQRIWTPLRRFGPSYQTFLLSILCIILATNSICKLFVDVLFNHNTTFLNKGKEKQPFRSNSAAFIIASRTVYARIRCEQTTEVVTVDLCFFLWELILIRNVITIVETIASRHKNNSVWFSN